MESAILPPSSAGLGPPTWDQSAAAEDLRRRQEELDRKAAELQRREEEMQRTLQFQGNKKDKLIRSWTADQISQNVFLI